MTAICVPLDIAFNITFVVTVFPFAIVTENIFVNDVFKDGLISESFYNLALKNVPNNHPELFLFRLKSSR